MRETVEMLFAEGWLMKIESWIETVQDPPHPTMMAYGCVTLQALLRRPPGTPPAARAYNRGLSKVCIGVARCRTVRTRARSLGTVTWYTARAPGAAVRSGARGRARWQ